MKTIIVLLAGLSVYVAHSHDQCSAQQAAVVAQQWTSAFADETHLRQFAHAFFTRYVTNMPLNIAIVPYLTWLCAERVECIVKLVPNLTVTIALISLSLNAKVSVIALATMTSSRSGMPSYHQH